jgi:hypothetical protein
MQAKTVTATGLVNPGTNRVLLKHAVYTATANGTLILRNGSGSGDIILKLAVLANSCTVFTSDGVPFEDGIYAEISGAGAVAAIGWE